MVRRSIILFGIGAAAAAGGAVYLGYHYTSQQRTATTTIDAPAKLAARQEEAAAAAAPAAEAAAEAAAPSAAAPAAKDAVADALKDNEALLTQQDRALVAQLLELDQGHLFAAWPAPGTDDAGKARMLAQLAVLDASYHGGIAAYVANARKLLRESKEGANTFEGYVPSVPAGERLDFASAPFLELEAEGLRQAGATAFVLVAGGLGERLGYSGIKVALPTESATRTPFLGLYIKAILALQARSAPPGRRLPLAIMTSDDTHARTEALLAANGYFGMDKDQVVLLKQEKVACLTDNDAHLALDPADPLYGIQTKPHGHGDVHMLLARSGTAAAWLAAGFKWVAFFQDTNALVFRGLLAALGVSARHDYDMNSLAVPRKAKEAIGAIARLNRPDGSGGLTINVEYNQLDPLLRATTSPAGDVNDATGWSPYPGNINQLVLKLGSYVPQLAATGGVISEFVNPKYKDATKTAFKSSTRLECMMQDYPKALPASAKVGFTTINQVWASYSPVKNSPADAAAKFKEGNPTHSATTGELDIYKCNCLALEALATCELPAPLQSATFNGITTDVYPRLVLSPAFAPTLADIKAKIAPGSIRLAPGAVLVLDGEGIRVTGPLEVRGALVVRAAPGARVTLGALSVENAGWEWRPLPEGADGAAAAAAAEEDRIRGFSVVRHAAAELSYDTPGDHGVVVGRPGQAPRALAVDVAAAAGGNGDDNGDDNGGHHGHSGVSAAEGGEAAAAAAAGAHVRPPVSPGPVVKRAKTEAAAAAAGGKAAAAAADGAREEAKEGAKEEVKEEVKEAVGAVVGRVFDKAKQAA